MNNTERYQILVEEICEEHDCLSKIQREALGTLLHRHFTMKDHRYEAAVEFLHMTDEIDMATWRELTDLA